MSNDIRKRMAAAVRASHVAAMKLDTLGMLVQVRLDDGSLVEGKLIALPWTLGHGAWVACVEGVSRGGSYDCARMTPASKTAGRKVAA